jgi:hypothetical protein
MRASDISIFYLTIHAEAQNIKFESLNSSSSFQ